jgi:nitroimidazol reductase NimA-like FMN-containing flavoprotein (pyridoxamine 5'-phosphate oxidase superfamily)
MGQETREEILKAAARLARSQVGGALATMHAEDGTPYVTFVLFHLRETGELLFGSGLHPQHTRNLEATPEASFLIDNREVIRTAPEAFTRVVVEGQAVAVAREDARYGAFLAELREKSSMAGYFTDRGKLFLLAPRRLVLMRGLQAERQLVEFEQPYGD